MTESNRGVGTSRFSPYTAVASTILAALLLFLTPIGTAAQVLAVHDEGTMSPEAVDRFIAPLFEGFDAPGAVTAVSVRELRIRSEYPDGTPTDVRVQVFVPEISPDEVTGVYLFAPGSTGLIGPCRASREHLAGIRWGLYRAHVLAFSGQGLIGILPDYIGFEDNYQVQPYFHAQSEARIIFDSFQAVHRWLPAEYSRFHRGLTPFTRVAGGFSQGGHAAFAAADYNRSLGAPLPLHGVIGYGPTAEIPPLLLTFPSLAPMMLEAFRTVYGEDLVIPGEVLRSPWAEQLTHDTTRQCVGGIQSYYPGDPATLFTESFYTSLHAGTLDQTHPQIAGIFRENAAGLTSHGVPALILQGTDDIVIHHNTQEDYVAALRSLGNPVDYRLYRDERHDTRQRAFPDVLEWIENLRR